MLLGALVDSGLPVQRLEEELSKLGLDGYSIEAKPVRRGIIGATQVTVHLDSAGQASHSIQHFLEMVDGSGLSPTAKVSARAVLQRIEEAEVRVHGENHPLHELGEIDTIVDVVGTVAGLEALGIERVYSSPLPCGAGLVSTKGGALPVPAPATIQIMAMSGALVAPPRGAYLEAGELVTPTGAALVTTLASFDPPPMTLERVGYGAGSRDTPKIPNVLALWIGESTEDAATAQVTLLETNIDDMTPELLGHLQGELLQRGALDAWFTPIYMKKNRPAVTLSVLCRPHLESTMAAALLTESSTLGVRVQHMARHEAERETVSVVTSLGTARVKIKRIDGKFAGLSPEYEDCREIALREGLPLMEVFRRVEREARDHLENG